MINKTLKTHIEEMKRMAETLVLNTFPLSSVDDEEDVLLLKQKTISVDGHEIFICYSKSNYGTFFLESLQIQPYYTPFLPFTIVCNLGRAFLGDVNLCYAEFIKNNKKIYCWTIRSNNGQLLKPDSETKKGNFEGFEFNILLPGSIDLF
jgi:hypothetical protein